jgi:putative hydrolase of the HAD superfamily
VLSGTPLASPAGRIRGVILDCGEVLCDRPAENQIERMAAASGLETQTFVARYHQERAPYDRGDYSPAEYWSRVVSESVTLSGELVDRLRHWDVQMWSQVNREMTDWLHELRSAGLKTAVLSNMHPDMARHVRRCFAWFGRLDCVILSCEVHLIKPDRAIYQRCIEGLGLDPAEACFIDDRDTNVLGAREAGLKALRFQTVASLRNDLMSLGVPVLPRLP